MQTNLVEEFILAKKRAPMTVMFVVLASAVVIMVL
jgi:hypothetical protein